MKRTNITFIIPRPSGNKKPAAHRKNKNVLLLRSCKQVVCLRRPTPAFPTSFDCYPFIYEWYCCYPPRHTAGDGQTFAGALFPPFPRNGCPKVCLAFRPPKFDREVRHFFLQFLQFLKQLKNMLSSSMKHSISPPNHRTTPLFPLTPSRQL